MLIEGPLLHTAFHHGGHFAIAQSKEEPAEHSIKLRSAPSNTYRESLSAKI